MTITRRGLFASAVALLALPRRVAAERLLAAPTVHSCVAGPTVTVNSPLTGYASRWKAGVVTVGLTGDFRTMRAAMDAVPDGGVVVLMPGNYEQINGDWTAVRSRPLWKSSDPRFDLDA